MIVVGTREHGSQRRRAIPVMQDIFHKSEWMESGDDPVLSPTVFLVEQPPDTVLVPHFHRQNQFQLFVAGGGSIGRHPLGPVTVHYAGAYTGYGPLVSGPEGITYFTIRPVCESGFVPVEGAGDRMIRGPKRHAQAGPVATLSDAALAALRQPSHDVLLAPAPDGLAAIASSLPPGGEHVSSHVPGSQGQFVFVLAGSLLHDGRRLGLWENLFAASGDPPPVLRAGEGGAQVVVLHTPPRDPAYG
jgi:hypothetical protein